MMSTGSERRVSVDINIGACVKNILDSSDFGPFKIGDIVLANTKEGSKYYEWRFSPCNQGYIVKGLADEEAHAKIASGARYRTGRWERKDGKGWRLVPCRG
jgi:hypothetical protein